MLIVVKRRYVKGGVGLVGVRRVISHLKILFGELNVKITNLEKCGAKGWGIKGDKFSVVIRVYSRCAR